MKLKGGFDGLHNAFLAQENSLVKDASGNARYHLDNNMRPVAGGGAVQSLAQKASVKKAASVSARNRRMRAGLPPLLGK